VNLGKRSGDQPTTLGSTLRLIIDTATAYTEETNSAIAKLRTDSSAEGKHAEKQPCKQAVLAATAAAVTPMCRWQLALTPSLSKSAAESKADIGDEASPLAPNTQEVADETNPQAPKTQNLLEAISRLKDFNSTSDPPSSADMERAEEQEFQKLQDAERQRQEQRWLSLTSIPRFFKHSSSQIDGENSLRAKVFREARASLLQRKSREELLSEEDLLCVEASLKSHARKCKDGGTVIDYAGFTRVREELLAKKELFSRFFTAKLFLKFPRDAFGCIAIAPFFAYIVRKIRLLHTRVDLSFYDSMGNGYFREKDMENFIFELIPTLPQLNSLQEDFYPFYVFSAVRKFFFFLDPKRTGRIHMRDILCSKILEELLEMRQEDPIDEPESNWFSVEATTKVYRVYLELDIDTNGLLNKSELVHYGHGMLTDVFIDRVFEEYQTYKENDKCEVDYKTFLDFALALGSKHCAEALHYFWKLLDIKHQGFIDGFTIKYFFRAIERKLRDKKIEVPSEDDVIDEIFDMVKPSTPDKITLQDLLHCGQGGTVVSMLIDVAAFWRYDNREYFLNETDAHAEDSLGL